MKKSSNQLLAHQEEQDRKKPRLLMKRYPGGKVPTTILIVISAKKISPCLGHGVIILGRPKLQYILEIHDNPQGCGILRWCRGPLRFCRTKSCTGVAPIKEMKRYRLNPSLYYYRILFGLIKSTSVLAVVSLRYCTYIEYYSMLYLFRITYWYDIYIYIDIHMIVMRIFIGFSIKPKSGT